MITTKNKLKVFIQANCQSSALKSIFQNINRLKEKYEIIEVKPVHTWKNEDFEVIIDQVKMCDIFLHQPISEVNFGQFSSTNIKKYLKKTALSISFPNLHFTGYHPQAHYLKNIYGKNALNPFAYHDSNIVKFFKQGLSIDEIAKKINNEFFYNDKAIETNINQSLKHLRARETYTDISMSDYIEKNMIGKKLFHVINHPTNELIFELFNRILILLNEETLNNKDKLLFKSEFLGGMKYPIYSSVQKYFNLDEELSLDHHGEKYALQSMIDRYIQTYKEEYENLFSDSVKVSEDQYLVSKRFPETTNSTLKNITNTKPAISSDGICGKYFYYPDKTAKRQAENGLRLGNKYKKSIEGKPLFTVITAVYNNEKTLERCIKSVLEQTYDNIEYIIIDGGSTDGTLDIINKYVDSIDYFISEPDEGIYYAMNKGISLASGDYITFMNSDDWYLENAITNIASHAIDQEFAIIYGKVNYCDSNENFLYESHYSMVDENLLDANTLPHQATFYASRVIDIAGDFSTIYKIAADAELSYRLKLLNFPFINTGEIVANYTQAGVSTTHWDLGKLECFFSLLHLGVWDINRIKDNLTRLKRTYSKSELKSSLSHLNSTFIDFKSIINKIFDVSLNGSVLIVNTGESNPFNSLMVQALELSGYECDISIEKFFLKEHYNILILEWEQGLFVDKWFRGKLSFNEKLSRLKKILEYYSKFALIVSIRHNNHITGHKSEKEEKQVAELIYSYCKGITFLGDKYEFYEKNYLSDLKIQNKPDIFNLTHPLYTTYPKNYNKTNARTKLKIKNDSIVILSFGALRHQSEIDLLFNTFNNLNHNNKQLLVVGKIDDTIVYDHNKENIVIENRFVSEKEIDLYLNACDIVFLPRLLSLNSGTLFLGISYSKIIVGPDVGNIGGVLKQLKYPVFSNEDEALHALNRGINLIEKADLPYKNHSLFLNSFNIHTINSQFNTVFNKLKATKIKSSMKVALFSTFIHGGAGYAAFRLHKALQENNLLSRLFLKHTSQAFNGVKTLNYVYKNPPLKNSLKHIFVPNRTMFTLNELSSDNTDLFNSVEDFDIINIHWIADKFLSVENISFLSHLNKPLVITVRDMHPLTGGCHYFHGCEGWMTNCMDCPQLLNNYDNYPAKVLGAKKKYFNFKNITIVALSNHSKRIIEKSIYKDCRIEVIPNSIETDVFIPTDKKVAKQAFNLPKDKQIIFFLPSYNSPVKGMNELSQALELLKDKKDTYHLLVAGSGSLNFQNDNFEITRLGRINDNDKLALAYSAADITIVPSLEETFSNTTAESISCGTPVVGFKIAGLPDMIKDDYNGYTVELGDIKGLAKSINKVLNGKDLSKNCREYAEDNLRLEVQAKRYTTLYEDLLSKPVKATGEGDIIPEIFPETAPTVIKLLSEVVSKKDTQLKQKYKVNSILNDRWYRFGKFSKKRKVWTVAKVLSKKMRIYKPLKPLTQVVKKGMKK